MASLNPGTSAFIVRGKKGHPGACGLAWCWQPRSLGHGCRPPYWLTSRPGPRWMQAILIDSP